MVSIDEYRKDPCRTSSLPYWKLNAVVIPDNMTIIHHRDFAGNEYLHTTDTPYFRLIHHLQDLPMPKLPKGYSVCSIEPGEYAKHINSCYCDIGISEEELRTFLATLRKLNINMTVDGNE